MTSENMEQGGAQRAASVSLEDFIQAVAAGVMRAMEAQGDTSGYAGPHVGQQAALNLGRLTPRPPWIIGIIIDPTGPGGFTTNLGGIATGGLQR